MAMRLEDAFSVDATPERAWSVLTDMPTVVSCMPGAELVETIDDSHWKTNLTVKLGPVNLVFDADLERELADSVARRMVLTSKAKERKGRGMATARVEATIEAGEGESHVSIVTDVTLSGAAAQFGRPVVQDVSRQLTATFASCLQSRLGSGDGASNVAGAAEPDAQPAADGRPTPVSGFSLLVRALLSPLTRRLHRRH